MPALAWRMLAGEGGGDEAAMEAAVFDEDFAGEIAADDHTREKNPGHVAFESLRVNCGLIGLRIERNSQLAKESEIRMITGEREHLLGGQGALWSAILHPDLFRIDARDAGIK